MLVHTCLCIVGKLVLIACFPGSLDDSLAADGGRTYL